MKTKIYLAYGSNLNLQQMAFRCPRAKVLGTTTLENYELVFRGFHESAVATVEPKKGSSVPVLLWITTVTDEKALDRYEGYPYLYRKENITVTFEGQQTEAYIYIMNDGRDINSPSCGYYSTIREGYEDCGFDISFLKESALKCSKGGADFDR